MLFICEILHTNNPRNIDSFCKTTFKSCYLKINSPCSAAHQPAARPPPGPLGKATAPLENKPEMGFYPTGAAGSTNKLTRDLGGQGEYSQIYHNMFSRAKKGLFLAWICFTQSRCHWQGSCVCFFWVLKPKFVCLFVFNLIIFANYSGGNGQHAEKCRSVL